jgi:hypothetical protein
MFKKLLVTTLVFSQVATSTFAAGMADSTYYFRYHPEVVHTAGVVIPEEPEEPAGPTDPVDQNDVFLALNVFGSNETLRAWSGESGLEIALREKASNQAYQNGATWTLVSGTLPPGLTPKVSTDTDVLSFVGTPTTPGTYAGLSWKVTDKNGKEIRTLPLLIEVSDLVSMAILYRPNDI